MKVKHLYRSYVHRIEPIHLRKVNNVTSVSVTSYKSSKLFCFCEVDNGINIWTII